jgi:hypothetical protein
LANLPTGTSVTRARAIFFSCLRYDFQQGVQLILGNKLREEELLATTPPATETDDELAATEASSGKDQSLDVAIAVAIHFLGKGPFVEGHSALAAEAFVYLEREQQSPRPPQSPTLSIVADTKHTGFLQ